jgi:hypothetical protein
MCSSVEWFSGLAVNSFGKAPTTLACVAFDGVAGGGFGGLPNVAADVS